MTNFSTSEDVQDLIGSELDSAVIDRLIEKADKKIKTLLLRAGLETSFVTVPDNINLASANMAAASVLHRSMVDGLLPSSQNVDGASASVNVPEVIKQLQADGQMFLDEYIRLNSSGAMGGLKLFHIISSEGERVGEYKTMSTAEEDET